MPYAVRRFPSPPIGEFDCRDVISEKPCIAGEQPTGKVLNITSRSPWGLARVDCPISFYKFKIHTSDDFLDIRDGSIIHPVKLVNIFIWKFLLGCVFASGQFLFISVSPCVLITHAASNTVCIMMTSSNGNIFRVTRPLCGEFTGPGEFPTQRPVTRSFDVFFDLRLNKRLSKQPWGWWFETLSWSLWRQCNDCTL